MIMAANPVHMPTSAARNMMKFRSLTCLMRHTKNLTRSDLFFIFMAKLKGLLRKEKDYKGLLKWNYYAQWLHLQIMIKINNELLDRISQQAKESARKRQNHNFHSSPHDHMHRMLNAMEPETYVQPHKHVEPDKREAFIILRGAICLVEFDEQGVITDHYFMEAGTGNEGAEITPRAYHTLIVLTPGTIIYEIKDGPWDIKTDKVFAPWAPEEGSLESAGYNARVLKSLENNYQNQNVE
jgi:cupin fold WbuC family metalloprotein